MVECLPSKDKTLSSNPQYWKKKKEVIISDRICKINPSFLNDNFGESPHRIFRCIFHIIKLLFSVRAIFKILF
jgi:hypothetical protein